MKRFLIIKNNKIIGERFDSRNEIQSEEIEDDGTYGNFGDVLIDGIWQRDPEEIKQSRIFELKEIITNKKLLDMDCTSEQTELKGLLGL